jgi:hypothetical protein
VLSAGERAILERGATVYKQIEAQAQGGGCAAVVFRVMAPPEIVWSVIFDFSRYPEWAEGVDEAEVYRKEGDDIYVRFKVRHWLAHHTYPGASRGWGTWRLDYSRKSDFDDSVGFWRVKSVPGDPGRSDVSYCAELKLKTWLPEFIRRMIAKRALYALSERLRRRAEAMAGQPSSNSLPRLSLTKRGQPPLKA